MKESNRTAALKLAQQVLDDTSWDFDAAEEELLKRCDQDPVLARSFRRLGVYTALQDAKRYENRTFNTQTAGVPRPRGAGAAGAARGMMEVHGIYAEMRLADGTQLGQATLEMLRKQERLHRAQAHGNTIRARFYAKLVELVDDQEGVLAELVSMDKVEKVARAVKLPGW